MHPSHNNNKKDSEGVGVRKQAGGVCAPRDGSPWLAAGPAGGWDTVTKATLTASPPPGKMWAYDEACYGWPHPAVD